MFLWAITSFLVPGSREKEEKYFTPSFLSNGAHRHCSSAIVRFLGKCGRQCSWPRYGKSLCTIVPCSSSFCGMGSRDTQLQKARIMETASDIMGYYGMLRGSAFFFLVRFSFFPVTAKAWLVTKKIDWLWQIYFWLVTMSCTWPQNEGIIGYYGMFRGKAFVTGKIDYDKYIYIAE